MNKKLEIKDLACDYCHRLPLHAGGCRVSCFAERMYETYIRMQIAMASMPTKILLSMDSKEKQGMSSMGMKLGEYLSPINENESI